MKVMIFNSLLQYILLKLEHVQVHPLFLLQATSKSSVRELIYKYLYNSSSHSCLIVNNTIRDKKRKKKQCQLHDYWKGKIDEIRKCVSGKVKKVKGNDFKQHFQTLFCTGRVSGAGGMVLHC